MDGFNEQQFQGNIAMIPTPLDTRSRDVGDSKRDSRSVSKLSLASDSMGTEAKGLP